MLPPTFLDSSTGQFSSFESSSRFFSYYNNMKSSSSNSNNGFSNLNESVPILGFNSPPLAASRKPEAAAGPGSNLSRPRLVKMRKQTCSHTPRSTNPAPDSRVVGIDLNLGPEFKQFRSSSESVLGNLSSGNVAKEPFMFGANRGNNLSSGGISTVILDDMRNLKIGSSEEVQANANENNAAFNLKVFGSENKKSLVDDELHKELNKLKIQGMSNVGTLKNSQGMDPINKSQFTNSVNSNVAVELQNEMKKMNLGSTNLKSSVFDQNSEANANRLSLGMQELNLSGSKEASGSSTVFDNEKQKNDIFQSKNLSGAGDRKDHRNIETEVFHTSSSIPSSFSSSHFQSFGPSSSTSRSEKKVEFAFTSKSDYTGTQPVEFNKPDMKSNLFSGVNARSKKKKGKLKKPAVGQLRLREDFVFSGRSSPENQDTFESYSPMDISPYHETLADSHSRETSVTSEEASQINVRNDVSGESHSMNSNVTTDEDLLDAIQGLNMNHGDVKSSLTRDDVFEPHINEVSEKESFKSATENLEYSSDTFVSALDSEVSSTATSRRQESTAKQGFNFSSNSENTSRDGFTFAASSSSQCQLPQDTRLHKKIHRLKSVHESYNPKSDAKNSYISSSSAELFPISGSSSISSSGKGQKGDIPTLLNKQKDDSKPVNEQGVTHVITSSTSRLAQEACEKWRLRGNQAYSNGDLAKAEDYYTQGLNSVSETEKSSSYLRALMLCYSNRAATRISLGRMREALQDCLMAATIDPNFLKVQVRAAHCYLAIGEVENATYGFMKCLQSESDASVDGKLIAEASEGLEKAKKVSNCIKQYTDLTQRRTSEDLDCALRFIDEALQISTYSEKLLQMKADTLLMLRRYERVIQVCEWTISSDEVDTPTSSSSRLWRSSLIVKSYFYLGRLDEALEFIKKQENSGQITERVGNTSQESVIPLADIVRRLLSHKAAGNEAYKSGKHAEAVEHYTAALSCNVESRPFTAICFCNRAAAYRALGQITDAIADCSLAIALDPNYLKAISRRASLYEMIRDYGQAAIDLQRLVSLLTARLQEKGALSSMNELPQTQLRLSNVEEESRKGIPLNMYLILGIEPNASAPDIKKAYRKAALKHHPDKAAQSLSRSDNGDDGLWKEIAENVHKDADRLFKMIGEAYAVLSNPSKRSRYDLDEEMRNEGNNRFTRSNSSRMATDSVFDRSGSQRQWQDSWSPYVNTHSGSSYRYSRDCFR